MVSVPVPICYQCKHFRGPWQCDAFPKEDSIPFEIITSEHDHRRPYPGDGGIQFEPLPDAAETGDESG